MKKLILAAFALTIAVSVFAQGTVVLNNRISGGAGVGQSTHIWGPSTTNPTLSLIGLGLTDSPSGTVDFAAAGMSLIGASGSGGKYGYTTTLAQLIGADGSAVAESSLVPVGQTTTFRTGTSLGSVAFVTSTLSVSPGAVGNPVSSAAPFASFEIVAWDNSSGQYPSWATASTAWLAGTIAGGHSA